MRRMPGERLRSCPPGRLAAQALRAESIRPSSSTSLRRSPGILRREPPWFATDFDRHGGAWSTVVGCRVE
jgi:hypothetical protein